MDFWFPGRLWRGWRWREWLLFSGIALLCYMPVLIVFNSILKVYLGAAWTLTYRWITLPPKLTEEIINPPQVYTYSR